MESKDKIYDSLKFFPTLFIWQGLIFTGFNIRDLIGRFLQTNLILMKVSLDYFLYTQQETDWNKDILSFTWVKDDSCGSLIFTSVFMSFYTKIISDVFDVLLIQMSLVMRKHLYDICEKTGADQLAHPRSLISTFVVRYLDSISILAKSKMSRLASLCS